MEPWKDGLLFSSNQTNFRLSPVFLIFDYHTACPGFVKADALAMAKHAELQTVDANQTVFFQGFGPSIFLSLSSYARSLS